jgi:type IV pilus assembly protein PilY1
VTTAPELASILEDNQVFRFVYVGTGRYLGDSDVVSVATQTMYGLIDDRTAAPTINPLRANLQEQTLTLGQHTDRNGKHV